MESQIESSREYFARCFAESERKRTQIIADVAASAVPGDDVEWLTAWQLHKAGLISSSELHATGSPNVLPKGWYYFYVDDQLEYCPTRVFGLEEIADDEAMVDLYSRGYRWMVVFSDATGPSGDRTFIDIRDFGAAGMTENPLTERNALDEVISMGYPFESLPADIRNGCAAAPQFPPARLSRSERVAEGPPPGWFPDPCGRHEWRWWAGDRWSQYVSSRGRRTIDPVYRSKSSIYEQDSPLTMSLDIIRLHIDAVDHHIVKLLAKRQRLVTEAAYYKTDDMAVRATDRRAAMMEDRHEIALQEGVSPEVVRRVFNTIIDAFIDLELQEHSRHARDA